jgi:hypothetical protein
MKQLVEVLGAADTDEGGQDKGRQISRNQLHEAPQASRMQAMMDALLC